MSQDFGSQAVAAGQYAASVGPKQPRVRNQPGQTMSKSQFVKATGKLATAGEGVTTAEAASETTAPVAAGGAAGALPLAAAL